MDTEIWSLVINAGIGTIMAVALLVFSRSSGRSYGELLNVTKLLMSYENERDKTDKDREAMRDMLSNERLKETRRSNDENQRHNQQMETFLAVQTELMKQLAADTMAIKLDTESIFKNQEVIKLGVNAMNNTDWNNTAKALQAQLTELSDKIDRIESILGSNEFPKLTFTDVNKTQKLAPPTSTVSQEKAAQEGPLVFTTGESPEDADVKIDKEDIE